MIDMKNIKLTIRQNTTTFSHDEKTIEIPVGYTLIENKFLKNTPPTYDEIEYAINYIEDEIEKAVKQLPSEYNILSDDKFVIEFAKMCDIDIQNDTIFDKDKLEYLFGQYAEVCAGKVPQSFQTDLSPQFYSKLLILREYMHHLKYSNFLLLFWQYFLNLLLH